jgi:hypothetical protein
MTTETTTFPLSTGALTPSETPAQSTKSERADLSVPIIFLAIDAMVVLSWAFVRGVI